MFFCFKQKTAYEMRISDWSSDVCSSDLTGTALPDRADKANWPVPKVLFADRFATEMRAHWERVFGGTAACVTPVLSMTEAPEHPHAAARGGFREDAGHFRPGVAPRFLSAEPDRKSAVSGKSVYVRVYICVLRLLQKKKK